MARLWLGIMVLCLVVGCVHTEAKKEAPKATPAPAKAQNAPAAKDAPMPAKAEPAPAAVKAPASPYSVEAIKTVGGEGRWDLLDVDPATGLLYVPRSTHCMVLEAATGKAVADIPNTPGVHGAVAVPSVGRGFTSNGEDGTVTIFDLKTNATLGKVAADKDADVIIYDPASKRVLVLCGDPDSMYAIAANVDPVNGKADVVDLKGKPEAGAVDGKGHAYVNLVDKNEIAVVDTNTLKITDRWPTAPGTGPTGMAIDAARGRIFVGCRNELMLAVDTATGKVIGQFPVGRGLDGTAFDDGYAMSSCGGDGTLCVVREDAGDKFTVFEPVKTATGARTCCADAQHHRVYLPTADFGPTPAPTPDRPRPRPTMVPGTFKIIIVKR